MCFLNLGQGSAGALRKTSAQRRPGGMVGAVWLAMAVLLSPGIDVEEKRGGEGRWLHQYSMLVEGAQPADVRVSKVSGETCNGDALNGDYAYKGNTADGKYYYAYDTKTSYGIVYLFYDKDSDGPGNTYCDSLKERWFIDSTPSTDATSDLDGDGGCAYLAHTLNTTSTTSLTPPTSAAWKVACKGEWVDTTFTITLINPPCAADGGANFDQDGYCLCPDGTLSCSGDCKEHNHIADVRVSGFTLCGSGIMNGDYAYQGNTADGKRYYAYDTQSINVGVLYLYYDKDSDGPENTMCDPLKERWFIDYNKPSTTATSDLDGDEFCAIAATNTAVVSTSSLTPPTTTTTWRMTCGKTFVDGTLTITPISSPHSDDSGATLDGDGDCLCPDGTPDCSEGCTEVTLQPGEGKSFYWRD